MNLIPHGYCLQWNPFLLWTLVISDSIITVSYFSIPFALWYFAKKRSDIPNRWLFLLFGLFIISCGATHFFDVLNIWQPNYWADAVVRIVTAALSLATAIALWRIMPAMLRAPSAQQLEHAKQELEKANAELEQRVQERTQELVNANATLQSVIINSPHLILVHTEDGEIIMMSRSWTDLTGYTKEDIPTIYAWSEKAYGVDKNMVMEKTISLYSLTEAKKEGEFRVRTKSGELRTWDFMSAPLPQLPDGRRAALSMAVDITERKQVEESLKLASMMYEHSSEAMMITDAKGIILAINPACTQITGYSQQELIGKNPNILSSGRYGKAFYQDMWNSINTTGTWHGEIWNRRKSGDIYAERLTINTIYREDGSIHNLLALFSDITEKKKTEELIWHQANYDELTGLPNRAMVYDRLKQEIKKSQRVKYYLAVMFIDLDHFKEINDTFGHKVGDHLLVEAAHRMVNCVRESDTVGRLGGDEFIVILSELDNVDSVGRLAKKILEQLALPFQIGKEKAYISASIGITLYPDDAKDVATLMKFVDQAMYAAKRQGRNRYNYYTPMMQEASDARMRLVNDLHLALGDNQFRVYYQPIVDLTTGCIHKAEALIRWQHPMRGLISPADFVPVAEETGLIVEIGDWVFRQAAAQSAHWRAIHYPEFQISVNKSPVQFRSTSDDHAPWFAYMEELGLPGQSIVIEITEGLLMEALDGISSQLLTFRDKGMQVSLDDFGTGYSSLSYLKKFHIDYIKIDQSFVRNLAPESNDLVLCEAMIVMAHKLNLKVIAEGVETQEQCNLLKQIGCDYGQGYLWSKPVPAAEFEKVLEEV